MYRLYHEVQVYTGFTHRGPNIVRYQPYKKIHIEQSDWSKFTTMVQIYMVLWDVVSHVTLCPRLGIQKLQVHQVGVGCALGTCLGTLAYTVFTRKALDVSCKDHENPIHRLYVM